MPSSVRRDIGQLLIGSMPGTTIPTELRSLAREFQLGGVILFARNIEAPEQVAELSHDVQLLALLVWNATWPDFPPYRHTLPLVFTSLSIPLAYAGAPALCFNA